MASLKTLCAGTSLVVQWLTISLPLQRSWVRSLFGELRPPHAVGQLNPCNATREPMRSRARTP